MDKTVCITPSDIDTAQAAFFADKSHIIAKNAVCGKGVRDVARVPEQVAKNTTVFDVEVKQGKRTNQKRSGRCWMFASLNTMRMRVMKKYKLSTFELSQAYPLFWDKLEKSNWFFENIIDTCEQPVNSREVAFLLTDPISDGGQWDMFKALVSKYGVCPKEAMPETACSSNTSDLDAYLTRYLRLCAKQLRDAHEQGKTVEQLRSLKKTYMQNVYSLLVTCLGQPPAKFDVRLRDKDDKLALSGTFTPLEFFKEAVALNLDDYISLISAPTADKPFNRVYTVSRLGNVVEAGGVRYINLTPQELKDAAIAQLKDNLPVWFGCDVMQSFLREEGIMDLDALDIDTLFGFDIMAGFDKAARLDYGESLMTHAMVLEGVNFDADGKPSLWKVENSWGDDHGKDGFDTLADSWFEEYVYQVVVDKKYLPADKRTLFESDTPIVLDPWDPMGSLA